MDINLEEVKKQMLTPEMPISVLESILKAVSVDEKACKFFWESEELVFVLLQCFIDSFYTLNTELFNEKETHKINTCINILTQIAQKIKIEEFFIKLQLDYYIYPFLMSSISESIKTSILKLFSALLRDGIHEGMRINELLPLLLKIIDSGSENCQTLSLETLDLILVDNGLDYAVQTLDRFRAIDVILSSMVKKSISSKNITFLKHLLKIYTRLCEKNNVKLKIKEKLPEGLETKEMIALCEKDVELFTIWRKFNQSLNQ